MRDDGRDPRRVLVTGAGGFIGRHLSLRLAACGHRVRALDTQSAKIPRPGHDSRWEIVAGDVADPSIQRRALEDIEVVYHLAAAHLETGIGEDEFRRVNVEAVRSLTDNAMDAGVRRFVHCSSVGVFGRLVDPPVDEEAECHPRLPYERSKLAGERVVREAIEQRGLPAVILRPAWVYGPGCARTERLFRAISRGRFVVAGAGRTLRHCVYIRDMVDAFCLAGSSPAAEGRVLIVADGGAVTVRDLVDRIAELTGARRPLSVPMGLVALAARAAEAAFGALGREPPISRRSLEFFQGNTAFRTDRARDALGWEPRYDLEAGLRETHRLWSRGEYWSLPLADAAPGPGSA